MNLKTFLLRILLHTYALGMAVLITGIGIFEYAIKNGIKLNN